MRYAVYQARRVHLRLADDVRGRQHRLLFIVYHLLHYTAQVQYLNLTDQNFATFMEKLPGQVPSERHDIFKMMVVGFSNVWVSALLHPGPGAALPAPEPRRQQHVPVARLEERGLSRRSWTARQQVVAVLIFLGYISIPVAILCGYGKEALK